MTLVGAAKARFMKYGGKVSQQWRSACDVTGTFLVTNDLLSAFFPTKHLNLRRSLKHAPFNGQPQYTPRNSVRYARFPAALAASSGPKLGEDARRCIRAGRKQR